MCLTNVVEADGGSQISVIIGDVSSVNCIVDSLRELSHRRVNGT